MFTVFGATGNTGSIVVERLLAAGKHVRAVVRTNDGKVKATEVVVGDVTDAAFVAKALAGAEGAYLMIPPDLKSNEVLAKNRRIVDNYAAGLASAKVPHAVFLSAVGAQLPSGNGPIAVSHYGEVVLSKTATKLTLLRAASFMENVLANAYPMKSDGVLPVFGGGEGYPFPMIASRDIGATAADALLSPPSTTQWIELHGPRDYSYVDAAAAASQILGRPVTATALPIEQMVPTLTKLGFSEDMAGLYREMTEASGKGLLSFEGKGRTIKGTTELADVLRRGLA
ncbi:MAG TPA: NmrA family NAD(P)-binding protein [Kofleriaceae bacterium]|jgi:uncharacterized protein YbjT (DUF2867 family)